MFHPFCARNPLACFFASCVDACWLPAVFGPLVLEGQEEAISLQLCPLPSPGDVGSFMVKLAQGLQGQTWASDWAEELRQADRQKEQTFRWGLGRVDLGGCGFPGAHAAGSADLRSSITGRRHRCL